ncbi:hypothetical protein NPIL_269531, partial [Nephila pilipes]
YGVCLRQDKNQILRGHGGYRGNAEPDNGGSLKEDIAYLLREGVLRDPILRTKTKTFPMHNTVLSARSSVFRATLERDFKKKSSKLLDTVGLEDNTLNRMLQYVHLNCCL